MGLAMRYAVLSYSILNIVIRSAKKQVFRIYAKPYVARVANKHTGRHLFLISMLPCPSVSSGNLAATFDCAIPGLRERCAFPQDAIAHLTLFNHPSG